MSRAALMLYEVSAEPVFLERARAWLEILDAHYWDKEAGGYFYSPDGGEKLIARSKSAHDNATPAGNGTLVGVLARLYHLTAEDSYLQRASALVRAFSGEIGERLTLARRQMEEASWFDHIVVNDEVERAADEVVAIADRETGQA